MTPEERRSGELLPCPFCGGEPCRVHDDEGIWCQIICSTCGARSNEHPNDFEPCILKWNTRIHPQPVREGQLELCASGLISLLYQEPDDIKQIRDYIVPELRKCLAKPVREEVEGWQTIDTAPRDGTPVLVHCRIHGSVSAIFYKGEWIEHHEYSREYNGAVWVMGDALGQIEVEEFPDGKYHDGSLTHWMPLPKPPSTIGQKE